ncbi:MAG: serine/threonine-protein kinase, partial [Proteobacteria bacterium]|nr:serine/threonine-protein kinase [Pseudomonadota bacterium]
MLKVAHADHQLARARMAREAEAMVAIGAPTVPALLGHGVLADGRPWIAMERIAGTNLADLIATQKVPLAEAIAVGVAILAALERVHAAGYAHRDLKPDNLVRRADGSIVLLDLGLARKLPDDPDDPTAAHVQVGSLEYMPPEQLVDATGRPRPITARADLYAFGCVLYELLAGRPPFVGDAATLERAHAALRPPPVGALVAVPLALEAVCHDLLAKEPDRRPASAAVARAGLLASITDVTRVREGRSRSVISEGAQPIVLLWTELAKIDRAILGKLAARKVIVVSQRGRRVVGAL